MFDQLTPFRATMRAFPARRLRNPPARYRLYPRVKPENGLAGKGAGHALIFNFGEDDGCSGVEAPSGFDRLSAECGGKPRPKRTQGRSP
jgi:hypothetical protein